MKLDNTILGELNQRANRIRLFRTSRINPEGLEELRSLDINWIGIVSEGSYQRDYVDYYCRRVG